MQITNIPVLLIWIWFGIRARDLFFFSNTNPLIKNGGVLGASKTNINDHLPKKYLPKSLKLNLSETSIKECQSSIESSFVYPIILKPDVGERGFLVSKIDSPDELKAFLNRAPKTNFIAQEYIDLPAEISVLYHRFPDHQQGSITSLCIKKPLVVVGDGASTLEELILAYPRARFQMDRLKKDWSTQFSSIPTLNQSIILESIGNHCRGATFLNGHHLIDEVLVAIFDEISFASKDLYYGRFDIKCKSIDSIKNKETFYILEYNGVASEPAHIYQPGYSIRKAYVDYFRHWNIIYQIHKAQKERGVSTITFKEAWQDVKHYFAYKKWASSQL